MKTLLMASLMALSLLTYVGCSSAEATECTNPSCTSETCDKNCSADMGKDGKCSTNKCGPGKCAGK